MAHVQLDNVGKTYPGNVVAAKDINLDIAQGEFIVIVGPSGCGKSTTLRMIAGLEQITEGVIRIAGRVVNELSPKQRDIAMVFQNYALYPHMTAYKNMAFGLKLRRVPRAEIDRKVHDTARLLGLTDLLHRKPRELSGGQRQRVALGRAIVREPAAFLFDEPLSNLDAKLRVEMRAELKRLHKRLRTTSIYVTHDQEEAMTLGDRVVVMSDGLIQQCAAPLTIYNQPVNRFVASFLGSPPMNLINGRLVGDAGPLRFEGAGLSLDLTPEQTQALAGHAGDAVTLGVRPEAFALAGGDAQATMRAVTLRVDVVEPLGDVMDVYLYTRENERVIARLKAEPLAEASTATLHVDMTRTHLFEPGEHGRNLTAVPTADAPASG